MGDRIDGRTLRYQHRRGELLEAVGEYVLEHGVASLSLRRVAEAVGVSHVTLQHHFGSKEQLVGEIVEHLLERTLVPQDVYAQGTPDPDMDLPTRWRALWAHLTSPHGRRDIRLFVEVLGQSQFEGAGYAGAVRRSIHHRIDLIAANVVALGCPPQDARAFATVGLATLRGLVIDLLATGERERVDEAFETYLSTVVDRAAQWERRQPALAERPLAGQPAAARS
ncbi:MAG TPA: TetR/AcrR family transcriptional regulator [Solirubrobacteraceae bacterium]|nr:TetR/AcrR family transcriptional regulator [Solirubrobacteraceae bacterium]